eukprot:m.195947 g.195947  ORF g.195947 m.195947 type:complete len:711 (-) comp19665_c0_seq1:173-2305(-)
MRRLFTRVTRGSSPTKNKNDHDRKTSPTKPKAIESTTHNASDSDSEDFDDGSSPDLDETIHDVNDDEGADWDNVEDSNDSDGDDGDDLDTSDATRWRDRRRSSMPDIAPTTVTTTSSSLPVSVPSTQNAHARDSHGDSDDDDVFDSVMVGSYHSHGSSADGSLSRSFPDSSGFGSSLRTEGDVMGSASRSNHDDGSDSDSSSSSAEEGAYDMSPRSSAKHDSPRAMAAAAAPASDDVVLLRQHRRHHNGNGVEDDGGDDGSGGGLRRARAMSVYGFDGKETDGASSDTPTTTTTHKLLPPPAPPAFSSDDGDEGPPLVTAAPSKGRRWSFARRKRKPPKDMHTQVSASSIGSDFDGFEPDVKGSGAVSSSSLEQHNDNGDTIVYELQCRWADAGFLLRNDGRSTSVGHVDEQSLAAKAGLPSGARIQAINGIDIHGMDYASVVRLMEEFDTLHISAGAAEDSFGFAVSAQTSAEEDNQPRSRSGSSVGFSEAVDTCSNDNESDGGGVSGVAASPITRSRKGSIYAGFATVDQARSSLRKKKGRRRAPVAATSDEEPITGFGESGGGGSAAAPATTPRSAFKSTRSGVSTGGDAATATPQRSVRFHVNGHVETPGVVVEGRPIQRSRVRTPPLPTNDAGDSAVVVLATFMNEGQLTVNQYARIVMMLEEEADDPLVASVSKKLATPDATPAELKELVKILVNATEALAEIV